MGNHRFKLSDMMPNAWFYKLRDMGKPKTRNPKNRPASNQNPPRKSLYHSSESRLTHNHSISSSNQKSAKKRTIYMPSPKHRVGNSFSDDELLSSYRCKTDIIIDVDQVSYGFDMDLNLPPIVTKPTKNKNLKKNVGSAPRKSVSRAGVKVRIGRRRSCEKKAGLFQSESLAIVKASVDPERDFKDSMMEMIAENNIKESKDLEDLLACYLSLNSNQYHGVIIKAFHQIWFNVAPRV